MSERSSADVWRLNPALRFYGTDEGGHVVELDDRQGRAMRMSISNDVLRLLERFRDECTWQQYREELLTTGMDAQRVSSIGAFLAGPCRDKRILISPGESGAADDQPRKPPYLNVMIELVPTRLVNAVSLGLHRLFSTTALILGGVVILIGMTSMFIAMQAHSGLTQLRASQVLGVGAIAALGIVLHEFGHAAAAYRLGARRVSIGIGWYLVIPVAYSELSELWRYPRRSRVIVDLAGVYMQGLLLAALMLLFHFQYDRMWLVAAGATATSILWNLNPFLRLDGYWIVADALGVHDLRQRAIAQMGLAVRRLFVGNRDFEERASSTSSSTLILYATLSSMFLGWLLLRAVAFLIDTLMVSLPSALSKVATFSWSDLTIAEWILAAIAALWQALLLYVSVQFVAATPARLRTWWRDSGSLRSSRE